MNRMTNFRSAAIATGNAINDSAYDNVKLVADNIQSLIALGATLSYYGALASAPIEGNINPINGNPYVLEVGHSYFDTTSNNYMVYTSDLAGGFVWEATTTVAEVEAIETAIRADMTTIIYGSGVPLTTLNPINGTDAIYVDTVTNTSYICKDATTDANVWVVNGSGQFADVGTSIGKAVQYMAQITGVNEAIVIPDGTNAFAVDSITVADGGSITIPNDSVFKVL